MKLLEGKVTVVTGAARGIGEGIALKLAQHGAHIAFTYVSESSAEKAKALEEKLTALGVKAKAYRSNAGNFAECESFINEVVKEFGTVDVCVNNAGIIHTNINGSKFFYHFVYEAFAFGKISCIASIGLCFYTKGR